MTQQPDNQNVSQKRDQSSTETRQDVPVDANLNDLVGKSRQATHEAEDALRNAGQGGQPSDQLTQRKEQRTGQENTEKQDTKRHPDAQDRNVNDSTDRDSNRAVADNIGNPDAAQGSSSDGDTAP